MTEPGNIDWPQALADHDRWLRKIVRCRVADSHAVDDIMQELAICVVRQTSRPTDPEKIAPWLYRLAVRQTINFHRQRGRRQQLALRLQHHAPAVDLPPDSNPLEWLVRGEQRRTVRTALEELDPQDNELLMLKFTENWTYEQLAQHLGISLNAIEYRLIRAKKNLRKRLYANADPVRIADTHLEKLG